MLMAIALAFAMVFGVMFVFDYVLERDGRSAAGRTSNRIVGVSTGVAGAIVMLAADSLHLLLDLPGVVIGAMGLGHVLGLVDVSPGEFVVVAAAAYVVAAAKGYDGED